MSLTNGTRLGPYEITGLLGAGGMGEVYKARDTRLDRTVAIKVLPGRVGADPVLRQRFEREARAISALDHPHICALYDVGRDNDVDYLVMQHLEGETVAARLVRGPLPLAEGVSIAAQIADALAAAHRRGIVHRDLKPGNVMLTRDGVRLLDFGLARQSVSLSGSEDATMTSPLTGERSIVGTLHYMAPEQLEGKAVDARTDIFALGVVLYEILTGRRAFEGESTASVIASILKTHPASVTSVLPKVPPAVARVIERCLAKDPDDRWQSASDLAFELRSLPDAGAGPTSSAGSSTGPGWIAWSAVAGLLAITAGALGIIWSRSPATGARPAEVRLSVLPPPDTEFTTDVADYNPEFALSPDGGLLAFSATDRSGTPQLWIRALSSLVARPIEGTAGARAPFWSPDGRSIGFMSAGGLMRVGIDGGTPQPVSSVQGDVIGTWAAGRILYDRGATADSDKRALYVANDRGGDVRPVRSGNVPPGEVAQRFPAFLPDGRHFIYLSWAVEPAERGIYLGSLDSDERTLLVRTGFRGVFVEPDLLLYVRERVLVAQRMTIEPPALVGEPLPLVEGLAIEAIPGQATFTASLSGVIAYRSRSRDVGSELQWVDRSGRLTEPAVANGSDISVSLAPDGRRAAITRLMTGSPSEERVPGNIWLLDLSRRIASRFTLDASQIDENPIWSPDGRAIAYASHRGSGMAEVRLQQASAPGARTIASGVRNFHPIDWSRTGEILLQSYKTGSGADDIDLWVLPAANGGEPRPLVVAPFSQAQGQFSPDGRWIAYTSNEAGRNEVYVRPYPAGEGRWQVSSQGGSQPRWRHDARELFYVSPTGTLMAVRIGASAEFTASAPTPLFTDPTLRVNNSLFFYGGASAYDVDRDGKRFLLNHLTRLPSAGPIHVVLNAIKR